MAKSTFIPYLFVPLMVAVVLFTASNFNGFSFNKETKSYFSDSSEFKISAEGIDCNNSTDPSIVFAILKDCTYDNQTPTASNPAPVTIQCSSQIPTADTAVVTDEADNCTAEPVVEFIGEASDGKSNPETITRTFKVSDEVGNYINVFQTITVHDSEAPTATIPAPVIVQCSSNVPAADISVVTTEKDNCTANPKVEFVGDVSDGKANPEIITRTYKVSDEAGNSFNVSQIITVDDTEAPTATNPAPLTLQCFSDVPAADISVVTTEKDNCTANPKVEFVGDVSDGRSNPEIITRTYKISDEAGNSINVYQTITVDDTEAPTATNPAPLTLQCSSDVPAADISIVAGEKDNCTAAPVVEFLRDVSDGKSNPETITRTYKVSDEAGNSLDVSQIITINDTESPTASNPAPITIQCSSELPAADISIVAGEKDNCTAAPVVEFLGDVSDGKSNPEIITRTYKVSDEAGNSINVSQTITINDTEVPTASNPAPITIQCSSELPAVDVAVVTNEADNCTATPLVEHVGDVSDGNANPETIIRTYKVSDEAGNSINVSQTITINDTEVPTASNPAQVIVNCSSEVPAADISVVTNEADNCTATPKVEFVNDVSDGEFNPETITRTYKVIDEAGNSINVTQTITIKDTQAPTASNPAPVTVQCLSLLPEEDILVVNNEVDNCTSTPLVEFVSDVSDGKFNPETITRTYSITDDSGNSTNVTQTITIKDTQAPIVPVLPTLTGECPLTVIAPTTTDNCDGTITGTTGITDLTFDTSGSIYWIFKDAAGNSTGPVEQKIIITDITAPVPDVETLPTKTIIGCQISSISELTIPTATDSCEGTISGTLSQDFQFPYSFYGTRTIDWEFIDSKGNKSIQTQEIQLIEVDIDGGHLKGIFGTSTFENQIDISSCGEAFSVELQLSGQKGTIVQWEKFALNNGSWEVISNNQSSYTVSFPIGALESTYFRVLLQAGTCKVYSDSFYIRALPSGSAPTVTNEDSDNSYCLGESVNLVAKSNYIATQEAIPNSSGDFNQGQLNTNDPKSWLVDGNIGGFTAGGNAKKPRNWSGTNNHKFGGIEYDSHDGKFAIAQGDFSSNHYDGKTPTTLESPIMDFSGAANASLDFDQAFYFANNDEAIIYISTDGGTNYSVLRVMHAKKSGVKTWLTAGTAASVTGSNATYYSFNTDNTSISLEEYIGQSNIRIKWSFIGTSDNSVWAMDNISVNKDVPVNTELEWTEGIGDPDENPIETGETEVPFTFEPEIPGIHEYGGTALINGCRTYGEEGTDLTKIYVSNSYAGKNIIHTDATCGQNTVQLNAYDNTISANENIAKGAFTAPASGCRTCDAPGTGDIGTWSWSGEPASCKPVSFSDVNDPDATFTAGSGTYTLTWTVNGCSNEIIVTITDCDQVDFDGKDDHVDFNNNYKLNGAFSLEVWVKPESLEGSRTIFSKRDFGFSGNAKGYDLTISNRIVSFNWDKSGTIVSPHEINTNRWYHIAVTHSESGEYTLYIDGIPVEVAGGNSPGENNNRAILGAMDNNGTGGPKNNFNGWLEEFRIWKVALTPEQIHLMMNQRIIKEGGNEVKGEVLPLLIPDLKWDDLIGYYRMNEIGCGNIYPYNDGTKDIGFAGKLKNITTPQDYTAPLPYILYTNNGNWFDKPTWRLPADYNGKTITSRDVWDSPSSLGVDKKTPITWNIVRLNGNSVKNPGTNDNSNKITLLALLDDGGHLNMMGEPNLSGNGLTITQYLELDGLIDLNGESQLIQPERSIAEGTGVVHRDQQGTASSFNYNYWSSPVLKSSLAENYLVKDVLFDGSYPNNPKYPLNINFGSSPYFADNAKAKEETPIKISETWLNAFYPEGDENNANKYSAWKMIKSGATAIRPGEGFTMKGSWYIDVVEAQEKGYYQNYTFKGFPNNGDIILRKTFPNQNYLIGNPYPSAISAEKFILENEGSMNGAIYFWDHFSGMSHYLQEYVGGYAVRNILTGVPAISTDSRINATQEKGNKIPGPFIPVGQGFFVNTAVDETNGTNSSIAPGNIIFKNKFREYISEANLKDSQFHSVEKKEKKEKEASFDRPLIRLNFTSPKGYWRQIAVAVDEKATNGIDYGYDAKTLDNPKEDMFWLINNGKFVIQGVPDFNEKQVLPLGIKISETGKFSIEVAASENLPSNTTIYILDKKFGLYYNIMKNKFSAKLEPGEYNDRYEIVFEEPKLTDESKMILPGEMKILYANGSRNIKIHNPQLRQISVVYLHNILGQEVTSYQNIPTEHEVELSVGRFSAGVYIIKAHTEDGIITKKVIIE